jgi:hypothetical protein
MQIYANKNILIDESFTSGQNSSIKIIGNIYYGMLIFEERFDFKEILDNKVNWKEAIASINFSCSSTESKQKHSEMGWLILDGVFELHKASKSFAIRCNCTLDSEKWYQLKKDLINQKQKGLSIEFNINQIICGRIVEKEDMIESKIQLLMESYTIKLQ